MLAAGYLLAAFIVPPNPGPQMQPSTGSVLQFPRNSEQTDPARLGLPPGAAR